MCQNTLYAPDSNIRSPGLDEKIIQYFMLRTSLARLLQKFEISTLNNEYLKEFICVLKYILSIGVMMLNIE